MLTYRRPEGLAEAIGMLRARRHLLTGDPVLAEEGHAMGLVTDLVDTADEVRPAAAALAERIAALPHSPSRAPSAR